MSSLLLERTRKINKLLQKSGSDSVIFSDICEILSDVLHSNVLVISKKGKLLGVHVTDKPFELFESKEFEVGNYIDQELNDQCLEFLETKENMNLNALHFTHKNEEINDYGAMIVPIIGGGERAGTLLVYKKQQNYISDDIVLAEYGATVVGLEILRSVNEENAEEIRKSTIVKSAIGTLSYSELEAIIHIFEELDGLEGLLVASKIADRVGITRSVIVNALRKFESAGVIESRSLGMKGTYIKVLNDVLLDELKKIGKKY